MTQEDYERLPDGTRVWFCTDFFAIPILGVIKTKNGERGIWVNFFGHGQCHFLDKTFYTGIHNYVTVYNHSGEKE